jgi:hypothetical protein
VDIEKFVPTVNCGIVEFELELELGGDVVVLEQALRLAASTAAVSRTGKRNFMLTPAA